MTAPVRPKAMIAGASTSDLDALERCLHGLDLEVVRAPTGNSALEQVAEHDLAFIVLDFQLSDMDGIEATHLIRCDRTKRHIPIVLLVTQDEGETIMFRAYEAGVFDHVTRPLQRGVLRSKARVYLDLHACRARMATQVRLLQQSNRDFQEFAHAAAHDLRAPLRSVRGMCELLKERGDDPECRARAAGSIAKGARRMDTLLKGMLDYARVDRQTDAGGMADLNACMADVLSDLKLELSGCGGTVEVGVLPVLSGDPSQLRRVLQNIVGNALKYRRAGVAPRVQVHCCVVSGYAQLSIADNGTGFDMKYAEELFIPFRRLVPVSSVEGSGIGMATARKIVERHGGTISARSTVGAGSTFCVRLPMTTPEITAFQRSQHAHDSGREVRTGNVSEGQVGPDTGCSCVSASDPQPGPRPRVLLVDDDDADRWVVEVAAGDGLEIISAQSAEQALDLLDETVALVLSDYQMPGADGIWLLSRVAHMQPSARRLLMSGLPDDRCAIAVNAGVAEHLYQKPVHVPELLQWLAHRMA